MRDAWFLWSVSVDESNVLGRHCFFVWVPTVHLQRSQSLQARLFVITCSPPIREVSTREDTCGSCAKLLCCCYVILFTVYTQICAFLAGSHYAFAICVATQSRYMALAAVARASVFNLPVECSVALMYCFTPLHLRRTRSF